MAGSSLDGAGHSCFDILWVMILLLVLFRAICVVLAAVAVLFFYKGVALYLNERRIAKFMAREQNKAATAIERAAWRRVELALDRGFPESGHAQWMASRCDLDRCDGSVQNPCDARVPFKGICRQARNIL